MSILALENHLLPLAPFLTLPGVTETCINIPEQIFVEQNSCFTGHKVPTLTYAHLEALACLIAEFNQQTISAEKPLLSASLLKGERVQIVMPPACEKGKIIFSIRVHQLRDMSMQDYVNLRAFDDIAHTVKPDTHLKELYEKKDFPAFIETAIRIKKNIIISGGTGTGKTTFLNACLKFVPHYERLITIEDTREVRIHQPNHVNLLASKGQQGVAKIRMQDLFESCLRLRPDRIFLSELRGEEAFAFLRAANSGHPGSLSTVHADSPQGCFEQMIFMMQQAGSTSTDARLLSYIKSIVPIVVQLKRCESTARFMKISEIYYESP